MLIEINQNREKNEHWMEFLQWIKIRNLKVSTLKWTTEKFMISHFISSSMVLMLSVSRAHSFSDGHCH